MRSYSQIIPTFWVRGSGKKLRGNVAAQLLALYFMTAPSSNMIGLYYIPVNTICSEVGISEETFRELIPLISEIVKYDFEAELAWLPECASYQIGKNMHGNDKRKGTVIRELEMAGSHPFAEEFLLKYGKEYGLSNLLTKSNMLTNNDKMLTISINGSNKGLPDSQMPLFPVPVPDPDPDPDQENVNKLEERQQETSDEQFQVERIFNYWKKVMNHPTAKLDPKRATRIRARLREGFKPEELASAIRGAKKDDFLMGKSANATKKYDGIHTLFRDAEKVEALMALDGQKRGASGQIYEEDKEKAMKKAAENARIFEMSRKKELEENERIANSGEKTVKNIRELLDMVNK